MTSSSNVGILEEGFLKKGDFGFKQLLMLHTNRISHLGANINSEGMSFNMLFLTRQLETFMSPYFDKKFLDDKKELEDKWKDFEEKNIYGKPENLASQKRIEMNREKSIDLQNILMSLMARKNLLMEESIILEG